MTSNNKNTLFISLKINKHGSRLLMLCLSILLVMVLSACTGILEKIGINPTPSATEVPAPPKDKFTVKRLDLGTNVIYGGIEYQTDLEPDEYYPSELIVLQDASHIINGDRTSPAPADAQVLGYISINGKYSEFSLILPLQPRGQFHDLDHDSKEEQGVQVFYIALETQHGGGPYFDNYTDWSDYFSTLTFEDPAATKLSGGTLLIWAEDGTQSFPSGFGNDGILFTDDDPVRAVRQGYTLINMDVSPFSFDRYNQSGIDMTVSNRTENRDLMEMGYGDAFNTLDNAMLSEYAFIDAPGKQMRWQDNYNKTFTKIQNAEEEDDVYAYYDALKDFASLFNDTHVSAYQKVIEYNNSGIYYNGHGFMLQELSDTGLVVTYIDGRSELLNRGIRLGDKLISIDGKPVDQYLEEQAPYFGSYSKAETRRLEQISMLTRDVQDTRKSFEFEISDGSKVTISSEAYWDNHSYFYGDDYNGNYGWPIEYTILDSGLGYIAINSNNAEEEFIRHMFENALDAMQSRQISDIIIDLRNNSGGHMIKFAEYFIDEPTKLANLDYRGIKDVNENDLQYEVWLRPYTRHYQFNQITVMIGSACVSACEVEAYAFGMLPQVNLVGSETTSGGVALIYGQSYKMPGNIDFNYSIGRFVDEDGNTMLEGEGVSPDQFLPESLGTVSAQYDWQLAYTADLLQYAAEMQMEAQFPPQPVRPDLESYAKSLTGGTSMELSDLAIESYPVTPAAGNTYTYHVFMQPDDKQVLLTSQVCAVDMSSLIRLSSAESVRYVLDGEEISDDYELSQLTPGQNQWCQKRMVGLTSWSEGVHQVSVEVTYNAPIYDGGRWLPAGTYTEQYIVVVKEE